MLFSYSEKDIGDYTKWSPIKEIKERVGNFIFAIDKDGELYGYLTNEDNKTYKAVNREGYFIKETIDLSFTFVISNIEDEINDLLANPNVFIKRIKDELYDNRDEINSGDGHILNDSVIVKLNTEYPLIDDDEDEFKESTLSNTLAQLIKAGLIFSLVFTKSLGDTSKPVIYDKLSVDNREIILPHYEYNSSVLIVDIDETDKNVIVLGKGLNLHIDSKVEKLPKDLYFLLHVYLTKYANITKDNPLSIILTKELINEYVSNIYSVEPSEGLLVNEMSRVDIETNLGISI